MGSFADSFTSGTSHEGNGHRTKDEVAVEKGGQAKVKLTDDDYELLRNLASARGDDAHRAVKVDPAHLQSLTSRLCFSCIGRYRLRNTLDWDRRSVGPSWSCW